jgi:hypothetical protein
MQLIGLGASGDDALQHVGEPGSTPRKMEMLEFGAGATAGIFYQLGRLW